MKGLKAFRIIYLSWFLVVAGAVSNGCASKVNLNMGESDYRVAVEDEWIAKYQVDETMPHREIPQGDSLSLHLKQVFIHGYSERLEKIAASLLTTTVRGEIAIVARVFETGQGELPDFRPSATKKLGRLIYYTEDVRTGGHLLNQSMLPIYGPKTYGGNPLFVQLTVLELDIGEAQQIKALLSTLANLGAKAYAPASPVLKALDALGEQLLSGEQDDIEFSFHFTLNPSGGHELVPDSRLAVGDYVVIRQRKVDSRRWRTAAVRSAAMGWPEALWRSRAPLPFRL